MNIQKVPISEVNLWDKNPRNIKTKDFERLKKQIKDLGVYKPMIAVKENGGYTVLGGNMRLRALKELGFKDVDISVVNAKTEAQKIKFALSDNDRAGEYDEQMLAELVYPHIEEINLEDYKVDLAEPWIDLKQVINRYGPGEESGIWNGMPEFESKNIQENAYICIVRFLNKNDIKDFEKKIGYKLQHKGKTYSTWYPYRNFNQLGKGLEFSDES